MLTKVEPKNTSGIPLRTRSHQNTSVRFLNDTFVRHAVEYLCLIIAQERKEHLYKE